MTRDANNDVSVRTKFFLESLSEGDADKFGPYLSIFESSCILSSFDEALMVIPFDVEDEALLHGLRKIHGFIRQTIVAKLGEKLLVNAVYKNDGSSKESASVLINRITADPTESGNGGFPSSPPMINVNFVKGSSK